MCRIDRGDTWNPFTPERSHTELIVAEAIEVAHGYRHLTIVHDDPTDVTMARAVDAFYDTLRYLADEQPWIRARGTHRHVTITLNGNDADERLAVFETAAALADPGTWTITRTAAPGRLI